MIGKYGMEFNGLNTFNGGRYNLLQLMTRLGQMGEVGYLTAHAQYRRGHVDKWLCGCAYVGLAMPHGSDHADAHVQSSVSPRGQQSCAVQPQKQWAILMRVVEMAMLSTQEQMDGVRTVFGAP